jgi:cytolysin (calcineurin-like family phosphatase)
MLKTDGASLTAFADGQNVLPSSHGHNDSGKTALRVRAVAVAGPMAVSVTAFAAV